MIKPSKRSHTGFTLVELVLTLAIVGVIAGVLSPLVGNLILGYDSASSRSHLVDEAELLATSITRSVRGALPNSIRVSADGHALEYLHVVAGGRYRTLATVGDSNAYNDPLDFTVADASFEVLGGMVGNTALFPNNSLVINNTNTSSGSISNAYEGNNVATIAGVDVTGKRKRIRLNPAKQFPLPSATRRFYVVDTPISYICDISTGSVRRYEGYAITQNHADIDTHAELSAKTGVKVSLVSQRLGNRSQDCRFKYDQGVLRESAIVALRMNLRPEGVDRANEYVTVLQQAHIGNAP